MKYCALSNAEADVMNGFGKQLSKYVNSHLQIFSFPNNSFRAHDNSLPFFVILIQHTESSVIQTKENLIPVAIHSLHFFFFLNHWLERSPLQIKIHEELFSVFPLENDTFTRNTVVMHLNRSLPSSGTGCQILSTLLTKERNHCILHLFSSSFLQVGTEALKHFITRFWNELQYLQASPVLSKDIYKTEQRRLLPGCTEGSALKHRKAGNCLMQGPTPGYKLFHKGREAPKNREAFRTSFLSWPGMKCTGIGGISASHLPLLNPLHSVSRSKSFLPESDTSSFFM